VFYLRLVLGFSPGRNLAGTVLYWMMLIAVSLSSFLLMTVECIILKQQTAMFSLSSHLRLESLTDAVLSHEAILDLIVVDWGQGKSDKKILLCSRSVHYKSL
jgi:hypothetical protein